MRRKHNLNLVFILFSILSVLFVTGCENIIFGGNIKDSVENDVQVTYKFYEFEDLKSEHNDVKYIIGRTAVAEDFPGFEHADTIIIGWRYFMNPETGRTIMPANFYTDERLNITSCNSTACSFICFVGKKMLHHFCNKLRNRNRTYRNRRR